MTKPPKEVQRHLSEFALQIEIYVEFGHSILEGIGSRQGGNENYLAYMMFRHFLELTDSLSCLIKESSIDPCKVILRTMVESSLTIEYLIMEDFERRSHSYFVAEAMKERSNLLQLVEGTQMAKQLEATIKKDRILKNTPSVSIPVEEVQRQLTNIEDMMKRPGFKEAFEEYEKITSNSKEKHPSWYCYWGGPSSLIELAQRINKTGYYEFYYRNFSTSVHSSKTAKQKLERRDGKLYVKPIRDFQEAKIMLQRAMVIINDTFEFVIEHLVPTQKVEYQQWYLNAQSKFYLTLHSLEWPPRL